MRKVLALALAVMLLLTLNVGALAEETASDIVAYGGGGDDYGTQGYVVAPKGAFTPGDAYTLLEMQELTSNLPDLYVGETLELAVYAYERDIEKDEMTFVRHTARLLWEAKDPEIATISSDGVVTAVSTNGAKNGIAMAEFEVVVPARSGKWKYDFDFHIGYNYIRVLEENVTEDDLADSNYNYIAQQIIPGTEPSLNVPQLELYIGETAQYGVFRYDPAHLTDLTLEPYTGEIQWEVDETNNGIVTVSDTGLVTAVGIADDFRGDRAFVKIIVAIPAAKTKAYGFLYVKRGTNPDKPVDPDTPTPKPPVVDSGAAPDKAPQATDNAANDDKTTDALASGKSAEVKVTNGSAGISVDTANTLGGGSGRLTLVNGGMTVTLPGGFGKVTEAGRIYYPFDYETGPKHASEMLAAVKTEGAKSEAVKAGGSMTLPTAATVTLKTKLTGTVNVYLYDEDTGKFTLVASPAAKDGTVTFTTRRMGYFLLTTGRV